MVTSITIDEPNRCVLLEIVGSADFDDMVRLHDDLGHHMDARGWWLVVDLNRAQLRLDATVVRTIAQWNPLFDWVAIIAPDDAQYGLARAYEIYSDIYSHRGVAVFRSRGQALRWLAAHAR